MKFPAETIHHAGHQGGDRDVHLYTVELPGLAYDGRVLVTGMRHAADGTEQWIAERLDHLASRNGYDVIRGRLYSPIDLTD